MRHWIPPLVTYKMALSTARLHRVRGRPPLVAAGINSVIHSHSSAVRSLGYVFSFIDLLSLPLLTPVVSRHVLLYQSLPTRIQHRHDQFRRRKEAPGVGTAERSMTEGRPRFPRRIPPSGGPLARFGRAVPTRSRGRGRRAPGSPLSPGAAVPRGPPAGRAARRCGRGGAPGPAS